MAMMVIGTERKRANDDKKDLALRRETEYIACFALHSVYFESVNVHCVCLFIVESFHRDFFLLRMVAADISC